MNETIDRLFHEINVLRNEIKELRATVNQWITDTIEIEKQQNMDNYISHDHGFAEYPKGDHNV